MFLSGFLLGSTLGGLFSTLSPAKLGFWNQAATDSDLRITLLRHTILGPTQIRTTIQLKNIGASINSANITLFYKDSSGAGFSTYSYNVTINIGTSSSKTFSVSLSVAQWVSTDVSIEEF